MTTHRTRGQCKLFHISTLRISYTHLFQPCCFVFFIQQVTLRLKGQGLGSTRCCIFPSAIFYILSKVNEDGSYIVVYRSESSAGDTPSWLPVTISIRSLCNGDKDRGLQFHFFQEGFNGYHTSLGYILTTVNRMKSSPDGSHVKLIGKNGKVLECWKKFRIYKHFAGFLTCQNTQHVTSDSRPIKKKLFTSN